MYICRPDEELAETSWTLRSLGEITAIQTIATGRGVHARRYLNRVYGRGHWRKMKGVAMVRIFNGPLRRAEVHWYEAHGIGKRDVKIKRYLDREL